MKRKLTHKQIEKSGWLPFLEFVVNQRKNPNDLKWTVFEFESYIAALSLAMKLESDMYDKKSKSHKLPKMMGLSRQVGR